MEPAPRPNLSLAGAGGVLIGSTAAAIAVGGLIGWALGNAGYGLLAGAIAGIPFGVFTVYRRYRDAF